MAKRKRNISKGETTQGARLAIGTLGAVLTGVILAGVLALLIVNGSLMETGAVYGVIIIHFAAAVVGSLIAGGGTAPNGLVRAALLAVICVALLLGTSFLFFDGVSNPVGGIIAIAVGSMVPALLQMTRKSTRTPGRRRYSC